MCQKSRRFRKLLYNIGRLSDEFGQVSGDYNEPVLSFLRDKTTFMDTSFDRVANDTAVVIVCVSCGPTNITSLRANSN